MIKKKSVIYLVIVTLTVLLVITSCMDPRKGTLNANLQPYITITNYFGVESDSLITESNLFQQTVQWSGTDEDGVVDGYAFRVLNENEEPIITPGHDVITDDGWVKFYTPSANQDTLLSESSETTIWFDQSYATINFPAADANGDSANVVSILEVKCIDDRGIESEIARKYFQAHSHAPSIFASSTKGEINGETISTAIIFEFTMLDNDPFVGDIPYYFEYKLEKRNLNNVVLECYSDEWTSTLGNYDISQSLRSALTENALIPNDIVNGVPQDSTFLIARAIDTALIKSETVEISFIVKEGFYPGTVIYFGDGNSKANGSYALGTNHYATYLDEGLSEVLPSVQTADGAHYATAFWFSGEEKYTAIGSNDFKTYIRWGYDGEFGTKSGDGVDITNNPHDDRFDITLDELTGQSYFCEIVGYDLRLDGEPYFYPPIPASEELGTLQRDDDGTEWLRVNSNFPIYQATLVTLTSYGGSLEDMYGEHTFEVRAFDLQGAVDLTPHQFTYTIERPVPKEEKAGVLIIDDDIVSDNEFPGGYVDTLYTYIISDYVTEHSYINREELNGMIEDNSMGALHYDKSIIAPSDLQQYKIIIYHSDNGKKEFDFWKEFEALKIYLNQGGNLILSSGATLKTVHFKCSAQAFNIFENYFGISMNDENAIGQVSSAYDVNPFFINALAEGSFNDIDLLLPNHFNNAITSPFAPFLSRNGLGPVAYFNEGYEAEVIYRYGCKPVDDPGPLEINPTQAQYDQYNGLPIALRKITENNSCYIFGYPLAFMERDQVKIMMTQILNELP